MNTVKKNVDDAAKRQKGPDAKVGPALAPLPSRLAFNHTCARFRMIQVSFLLMMTMFGVVESRDERVERERVEMFRVVERSTLEARMLLRRTRRRQRPRGLRSSQSCLLLPSSSPRCL